MAVWVFWIFCSLPLYQYSHDAPCNPYVRLWQRLSPLRIALLASAFRVSLLNSEFSSSTDRFRSFRACSRRKLKGRTINIQYPAIRDNSATEWLDAQVSTSQHGTPVHESNFMNPSAPLPLRLYKPHNSRSDCFLLPLGHARSAADGWQRV